MKNELWSTLDDPMNHGARPMSTRGTPIPSLATADGRETGTAISRHVRGMIRTGKSSTYLGSFGRTTITSDFTQAEMRVVVKLLKDGWEDMQSLVIPSVCEGLLTGLTITSSNLHGPYRTDFLQQMWRSFWKTDKESLMLGGPSGIPSSR